MPIIEPIIFTLLMFITSCIVDDPIADENTSEADDPSNFGFINSYF